MGINDLHTFLYTYFTSHQCHVDNQTEGILNVQLTEEMDKVLMNRPFYWHYIKQMGREGDPAGLSLITALDKAEEEGEMIHFGSPRLQQIMQHLKTNERFTKLFEQVNTTHKVALYPWLVINIKISYQGKQKKDEIFSIGLHLINGQMRVEMMESLKTRSLQMGISDYCYTISPIITLQSGFKRMEAVIDDYINKQTHEWAIASKQALQEEIKLLEHFYEGEENVDTSHKQKEINELIERYEPKIMLHVINGGIFYLHE